MVLYDACDPSSRDQAPQCSVPDRLLQQQKAPYRRLRVPSRRISARTPPRFVFPPLKVVYFSVVVWDGLSFEAYNVCHHLLMNHSTFHQMFWKLEGLICSRILKVEVNWLRSFCTYACRINHIGLANQTTNSSWCGKRFGCTLVLLSACSSDPKQEIFIGREVGASGNSSSCSIAEMRLLRYAFA